MKKPGIVGKTFVVILILLMFGISSPMNPPTAVAHEPPSDFNRIKPLNRSAEYLLQDVVLTGELESQNTISRDEASTVQSEWAVEEGVTNSCGECSANITADSDAGDTGDDDVYLEINKVLADDNPVFLFIYAEWCHFCQDQKPIIDELEEDYGEDITFIRVNSQNHPQILEEFGVSGFPAMFLITRENDEGYIYQRFSGFVKKEVLSQSFDHLLDAGNLLEKSDIAASEYDYPDLEIPEVDSQQSLSMAELQEELAGDAEFKQMHDQAREVGYIYPSTIQKLTYSNGTTVILAIMASSDNSSIFLSRYSSEDMTHSSLLQADEQGITLFDSDGGIKFDADGSASIWSTHHSCVFSDWSMCSASCITRSGHSWVSILHSTLSAIVNCAPCAACLPLCYATLSACGATIPAGGVGCASVALCLACLALASGPTGTGCIECLQDIYSVLEDLYNLIDDCTRNCANDPTMYPYPGRICCHHSPVTGINCPNTEQTWVECGQYNIIRRTCNDCDYDNTIEENCSPGYCREINGVPTCVSCVSDADCDIYDYCTRGRCIDHACEREPINCDDHDPCTNDWCDPALGCMHAPIAGCDHPDDTFEVSSPSSVPYDAPDAGTENDNVAVLRQGDAYAIQGLLTDLGIQTTLVDIGFDPELVQEHSTLVIPSGGLYGLDSLESFKSRLAGYVESGGTLIAFPQQHGYEYNALPGGEVDGYGWLEDQSCQYRSVVIATYHPVLSGQDSNILDVNVDGFFTGYSGNATILLNRIKNGMPAMLLYEYGEGRVIATTAYTDWAYKRGQATQHGKDLVRDMMAWARDPAEILEFGPADEVDVPVDVFNVHIPISGVDYPQYVPGDLVTIPVEITNKYDQTADRVVFSLYDPDYVLEETEVSVSIAPDEMEVVDFTYSTNASSKAGVYLVLYFLYSGEQLVGSGLGSGFGLGIDTTELTSYQVRFTLKNPDGTVIQEETSSLTIPPGQSVAEHFIYTNPAELGIWSLDYEILDHTDELIQSGVKRFAVSNYEPNPEGWVYKGREITFSVTSDKEEYVRGSGAEFTVHLWNHGDTDRTVTCWYSFPHNYWLTNDSVYGAGTTWPGHVSSLHETLVVPAQGTASFIYGVNVYSTDRLWAGFYEGDAASFDFLGGTSRGFFVFNPRIMVDVSIDMQEYWKGDNVSIALDLNNIQTVDYDLNTTVTVKDLEDSTYFEDSFNGTLLAGESEQRNYIYTIPLAAEHGIYAVDVDTYEDGSNLGAGTAYFRVRKDYELKVTLDSPNREYRARDSMNMSLEVTNRSATHWASVVDVSIPDMGFAGSANFTLDPGETETVLYNLIVPESITAGTHIIVVTTHIDNEIYDGCRFYVPQSRLEVGLETTSYQTGEELSPSLTNSGGIDTTYDCSITLFDSGQSPMVDSSSQGDIMAGESLQLPFTIPGQAATGKYYITVSCRNLITDAIAKLAKPITISGLEANLVSVTDKKTYFTDESIFIDTGIENLDGEIIDGALDLQIIDPWSPSGGNVTEAWIARYDGQGRCANWANDMAMDGAGNIYVTGRTQSDVVTVKYDNDGNELWVARYDGIPDLYNELPDSIAVDGDGNAYVTALIDMENQGVVSVYRVTIKYDTNGNEQWVARYEDPVWSGISGEINGANEIIVDDSGAVYVAGVITNYSGDNTRDYLVVKYDADGNQLWATTYDGPTEYSDDRANDIAVDGDGNVYVTGRSNHDYATVKYSPDGTELWSARYDGAASGGDEAEAIGVDAAGNVYVTGYSQAADSRNDYATVKYDPDGTELWAVQYDGTATYAQDKARDLAVDNSGNIYVTGYSQGTSSYDYATVKYDTDGTELWVARYEGPGGYMEWANDLVLDESGNVYVTGAGAATGSGHEYATVKYDNDGNELWAAAYNGNALEGNEEGKVVAVDPAGNVYITGSSESNGGCRDFTTIKYDSAGNELWVSRWDGPGSNWDDAVAIALDADGNVYTAGTSRDEGCSYAWWIDPSGESSPSYADYVTVKYDSNGNRDWTASYNGPESLDDEVSAIVTDDEGNVYVTGYSERYVDNNNYHEYTTIKYDTDGTELWVAGYHGPTTYGKDEAQAIAVDDSGNVYVTGNSENASGYADFATVKYDGAGNELWDARYNGPASGIDQSMAVAVDGSGNVYVCGYSAVDTSSTPESDLVTIKYDANGNQLWVATHEGPELGYYYDPVVTIDVDEMGNVYVSGDTNKDNNYSNTDFVTVKYDADGNEDWAAIYKGPADGGDLARGMALDSQGNVYVTGASEGIDTRVDYATVKYDTAGNQLWVTRYDGPGDYSSDGATAITVDEAGFIYVTGLSTGYNTGGGNYYYAFTTLKYDSSGNQLWIARYDRPAMQCFCYYSEANLCEDSPNAIAADGSNNVYVVGKSSGSNIHDDFITIKYVQGAGEAVVWEKSTTVTVPASATENLTDIVDISAELPGTIGKLELAATLSSALSQVISQSERYSFFITDSETALTLETDKEVYKPEEAVLISGEVHNGAPVTRDFMLSIARDGDEVFSDTFNLASGESHAYATSIVSENSSFVLQANADGTTVSDFVDVISPDINITIIAPDIAGMDEFGVGILLENTEDMDADLSVSLSDETWNVLVPMRESLMLETTMSITEDTILTVTITGDVEKTADKPVTMGEDAHIEVSTEPFYLEGLLDIPYTVENTGLLDTSFNATFTVGTQTIVRMLFVPQGQTISDTLPFNLTRGIHSLYYGSPFGEGMAVIQVGAPAFEVVLPLNVNSAVGQEATWIFGVTNIGGAEGEVDFRLILPDWEDTRVTQIRPGEQEDISFTFLVPDDLEENEYKAIYELNGERDEFSFFVQGAKISVDASLDKSLYVDGETANLTLEIANDCAFDLSLYARVQLHDYEEMQTFNLPSSANTVLQFDVPVSFNGSKLFYGIYMDSGRALHLNSLYIYEQEDTITLYTDKQVYLTGETVTIYVESSESGNLSITAPGYYEELTLDGSEVLTFPVPELRSGTYYIEYSINSFSSSCQFDVIGYSARIMGISLDRELYYTGDTIVIKAVVDVNRDFNGLFRLQIYDSRNSLIEELDVPMTFVQGENTLETEMTFSGDETGIYNLNGGSYGDLPGQGLIRLASGARYFDGEVPLLPGDANDDNVVNIFDMTKVARIILEMDDPTPQADANQDGSINIFDMTKIARIILELD